MDPISRNTDHPRELRPLRTAALVVVCVASVMLGAASRAGAAPLSRSAWDRPALKNPATIVVDARHNNLVLDRARDYIIKLTPGVDSMRSALTIWGGRNIVIDGGKLRITGRSGGMALKNQTGVVWVHDLHISGRSNLLEGIDLQEPDAHATVVLRDLLIDEVHGSYRTNHADLLQTWAGPSRLLIDGFTGTTGYQGFFLTPNQWDSGRAPRVLDLRNVDIVDKGGYALWLGDVHGSISTRNVQSVYVIPNPVKQWRGWWLWGLKGQDSNTPGAGTWGDVMAGRPPRGHYVHATRGGASGIDEYVSPIALPGERQ
jgi:hypothetical protein